MTFKPETFDKNIAYVTDAEGNVFQVINEQGDGWDELATQQQMAEFYAKQDVTE